MQFRVLGPLEVDAGEGPIPLGGPKQRAVLAGLLMRPNQVVAADTLIAEVWGDEPPDRARHTLQTYISNLRRSLGEDRVRGRTPGYVLVLDPTDLDAARFDALVRDAREALPLDPNVAIATLDDALQLWRGPALADLADRSSIVAEAARLDDLRLEAQEARIEGLLAIGAPAAAVGELENLVAQHPLRESLWGRLVLALYRDGRQADALGAYQRARELLADDLGIDPSPELVRLHERVLKQDPGLELRGEALRGYRLLERIDAGPTGTVFRAIQPHVGRDVAIKVFHEHVAIDPAFVRRFEADTQTVAALEHPHIAPVYDSWREPGRAYVVTRFFRGGTLRGYLERGSQPPVHQTLRVVEQVASALAFAHGRGVTHGHVGTSNAIFDAEGNAYLTDFGIGIEPRVTRVEDVRAFATFVGDLIDDEASPRLRDLVIAAELGVDVPDAAAFAEAARAAMEPTVRSRPPTDDVRNPYKGLRAFKEVDAADFFGRKGTIGRVLVRLDGPEPSSRFLAVVGPSGSGKSSLVRAGVVPALRRSDEERWVADMYPGLHPLEELGDALLRIAVRPSPRLDDVLRQGPRGLLEAVELVVPGGSEVVLVVDQFEELFTQTASEAERVAFLELLRVATAEPSGRLRVIVTLRADFYDRPLAYPRFGDLLATRTEGVPPLTPDELEQVIRKPAEREGVALEAGLVAEMIADVADQPGALPLLQFALTDMFEQRDDGRMALDAYHAMGGIGGALSARAERIYVATDDAGRRATKEVLLRLVTLGEGREDTRRRVPRKELDRLNVDPDAIAAVLDTFGRHRLLTFDREPSTREPTVEVAHEALLGAWRRLGRWIDDAREDLRIEGGLAHAAAEWRGSGGDPSFLLHGAKLEQIDAWMSTATLAIGRDVHAYVRASIEQHDLERADEADRRQRETRTERRAVRRLRTLVAVFAIAALVAASLTVVATRQSDRAERAARIATAKGLAAAAVANLDDDPERSILLAAAAIDETRSVDGSILPEAEEALHRAVTTSRVVATVPGTGGSVAWGSGGVFVSEGPPGSGLVDIRDVGSGSSVVTPFRGHDGDITGVAFSPDGSMLATTGRDGALRLWDPTSGSPLLEESHHGTVADASFSHDGSLVAAVWGLATTRIIEVDTGRVIRTFGRPAFEPWEDGYGVLDAALSADGRRIAIVSDVGGADIMSVESGARTAVIQATHVNALAWSPDDRTIVTGGSSGIIEVWRTRDGALDHELPGQRSFIWDVAWSPDGSHIASGGDEGSVQIWHVGPHEAREILTLRSLELTAGIGGVTFSPNGAMVLAGSGSAGGADDRPVSKIWDVSPTGDAEWANVPAPRAWGNVAFLRDGTVAVSHGRASATVWSVDPRRKVRTIGVPHRSPGGSQAMLGSSPDGDLISIVSPRLTYGRASVPGRTVIYDASSGHISRALKQGATAFPVWDRQGDVVAFAAVRGGVRIVDRAGRSVAVLGERHGVAVAAFDPEGRLLAMSVTRPGGEPEDGSVRIWDREIQAVVQELAVPASHLAFDPSGAHLLTYDDGQVQTWDVRSGERLSATNLADQEGHVWAAAFTPDASRIALSHADGTIRFFDTRSGAQVLVLRGHVAGATDMDFSSDGSRLVSVGFGLSGDTARVWALDVDDLLAIAKDEVTRSLTPTECMQYLHRASCDLLFSFDGQASSARLR